MYMQKFEIREIKTTAKGPDQENREILTPRNFYSNCFITKLFKNNKTLSTVRRCLSSTSSIQDIYQFGIIVFIESSRVALYGKLSPPLPLIDETTVLK